MKSFSIAGRAIGADYPPYVIAELSGNHNGEIERALHLMRLAKDAGADAIKIQTYTPDTITIDHNGPGFTVEGGLWDGRTLYDLFQEAHTPWEWHEELFAYGKKLGVPVFSTPFDNTAVDLLEKLGAPAYKIASFEAIDLPLVQYVARTGKPMIVSTGITELREIEELVEAARSAGCKDLALLHCVSAYPAPVEDMNLRTLADLAKRFDVVTGLSDHTLGTVVASTAAALGASIIEKHLTTARADGGPDSAFSLEPDEFTRLVADSKMAFAALGKVSYEREPSEQANLVFRRSLYAVADIAKDVALSKANVRSIRPGYGLPPKHLPDILGKKAARDIARGTPLAWDMIG